MCVCDTKSLVHLTLIWKSSKSDKWMLLKCTLQKFVLDSDSELSYDQFANWSFSPEMNGGLVKRHCIVLEGLLAMGTFFIVITVNDDFSSCKYEPKFSHQF